MTDGQEIADFAIDFATKQGAKYAEARFEETMAEGYTTRNGVMIGGGKKNFAGIGMRVLTKEGMGFCSTAKLDKDEIKKAIKIAVKMARASRRKEPIKFSEEKAVQAKWQTPVEEAFEDIADEDKIQFVQQIDKTLMEQEFGSALVTRTLILDLTRNKKYFTTNEGTKIESEKSLIAFYTFNTAKGVFGTEQRFYGQAGAMGWEWFKKEKILDKIIEDNRALVKTANLAKEASLGVTDVIVSGEVAGIIAHENCGHPSEADRILGREGAQAGESFYIDLLEKGTLGEIQLGSEVVTIIDDPTLPGGAGFYEYDDEGVKARPRFLIKNGRLNELLFNREFAAKFNTQSNAAARAIGYNREPIIRMANTYFAPGKFTLEELFEDVKKGLYMKSFTEWNIDDRRYQSKYVGLEAYIIENGELTEQMVRRPILELTTKGIFGSVDAVSKETEFPYGTCGKSDPAQGAPCWMGGAQLRLRNIRLGGGK
ncbi:TldD/PmbA family protein [Candidatus Heimdallarchaeota archaeon]|nr:MAG: TldD/PmbA family protein [Candidatus Gerdarchaeota archaeon]RLI73776.1 MAG: TldD/PmbA family protein [Candidatus Heimdallarchaeota archaeon]